MSQQLQQLAPAPLLHTHTTDTMVFTTSSYSTDVLANYNTLWNSRRKPVSKDLQAGIETLEITNAFKHCFGRC